jgi:hypothetical protein
MIASQDSSKEAEKRKIDSNQSDHDVEELEARKRRKLQVNKLTLNHLLLYPRKACILESHYNLHAIVASVLLHAERPNSGLNLCGVVWGFANVVAASFEFKVSSAMSQDAIKLCQMKS